MYCIRIYSIVLYYNRFEYIVIQFLIQLIVFEYIVIQIEGLKKIEKSF